MKKQLVVMVLEPSRRFMKALLSENASVPGRMLIRNPKSLDALQKLANVKTSISIRGTRKEVKNGAMFLPPIVQVRRMYTMNRENLRLVKVIKIKLFKGIFIFGVHISTLNFVCVCRMY